MAVVDLDRPIHETSRAVEADILELHTHLTNTQGFFIDRETYLLLSPKEVSDITDIPPGSVFSGYVNREQLRSWNNLPDNYQGKGISLLSVFEFQLSRAGGKVEAPGEFSTSPVEVALQKDVLEQVVSKIPSWKQRGRIVRTEGVTQVGGKQREEKVPYVPVWKRLPPSGYLQVLK